MNTWTWILIAALVLLHLLDLLADYLNLRSLNPSLPPEFEGVYDAEAYERLQRYTAVTTQLDAVKTSFKLLLLLGFWLVGGFNFLDVWVRALELGPILNGLVYVGAIYLGATIASWPFAIYDTFVIEERFGFNKTTPVTFVTDRLKGLLLATILGGGLVALLLWVLESAGPGAWLYAWAAVSVILVCVMYLAPAVILPLFNKFSPLPDGELREAIVNYAKEQQFSLAGVYVMDGSRRSTRANAFFTGFGKTRKIVLFDTLIENHTTEELLAVLAHEIGHFKLRHILRHMGLAILNVGIFLFLASQLLWNPTMFEAFGVERMSVYAGLAIFSILYSPLSQVLSVFLGMLSRRHEFEADAFAARTTGQPQALSDALKKLSRSNLANLSPHPLQVMLHHTHPPVLQRIQALNASRF